MRKRKRRDHVSAQLNLKRPKGRDNSKDEERTHVAGFLICLAKAHIHASCSFPRYIDLDKVGGGDTGLTGYEWTLDRI